MDVRSFVANGLKWAILLACLTLTPSPTLSHGNLTMDEDYCKLRLGRYMVHFASYQPDSAQNHSRIKEFCADIPVVGRTFVVLDLIDPALRKMPISIRVLEERGRLNDDDAPVVFELSERSNPTGSFSYRHNFDKPGKFVGLIAAVNGADRLVARFPFSVGRQVSVGRQA